MKINFQNHKQLFEAFINHNILVWKKNSKELYTNKMYSDKPADDHVIKTRRHFCLFSIAVRNISSFFFMILATNTIYQMMQQHNTGYY